MFYTQNLLLIASTLLLAPLAQANLPNPQQVPLAGYIGIGLSNLTPPVRAHMPDDIAENQGLYVAWLADVSPAADDGVKLYDVLVSYDGKPIETPQGFIYTVRQDQPGRIINIKLVRQGKVLTLPITLGSQIKRQGFDQPPIQQAQKRQPQPQQQATIQAQGNYPPVTGNRFPANAAPPYPMPGARTAQQAVPLNITGKPAYPMRKKPKKEAWGDERNIWSDFYTDSTGDMWDDMINAPFKMGRMPGGWRAPSWSSPDPVTVGDAVLNQVPPIMEEAGNMADFTD